MCTCKFICELSWIGLEVETTNIYPLPHNTHTCALRAFSSDQGTQLANPVNQQFLKPFPDQNSIPSGQSPCILFHWCCFLGDTCKTILS